MSAPHPNACEQSEATCAYAMQALDAAEAASVEAHIGSCPHCRRELETIGQIIDRFVYWPTEVLRSTAPLQERLALRIAHEIGEEPRRPPAPRWAEPAWEEVAPGIECKLLASDEERSRISMLVRLAPGASYPPHTHADIEELHLLDGELWIDERKLIPGDFNFGPAGASDEHVWSATGCACLLITSTRDLLR